MAIAAGHIMYNWLGGTLIYLCFLLAVTTYY